jgi:hypothetical protein
LHKWWVRTVLHVSIRSVVEIKTEAEVVRIVVVETPAAPVIQTLRVLRDRVLRSLRVKVLLKIDRRKTAISRADHRIVHRIKSKDLSHKASRDQKDHVLKVNKAVLHKVGHVQKDSNLLKEIETATTIIAIAVLVKINRTMVGLNRKEELEHDEDCDISIVGISSHEPCFL